MLAEFFKSMLVGICAAAPLGPVAAIVIQKTLLGGRRTGFITGLGSAVADFLYAVIGIFALGVVRRFVEDNMTWMSLAGGVLVLAVGVLMMFRDPFKNMSRKDDAVGKLSPSYPLQAFLLSIANPGALVLMLALVALYGIGSDKLLSILGVAAGLILWWFSFSFVIDKFSKKFNINTLVVINKLLGGAVAIFGIVWAIRAFLKIV